jgi:hypothetical protein
MEYIKLTKKVKLRNISQYSDGTVRQGITIPKLIASKFEGTSFDVTLSGDSIILESGATNG